MVQTEADFIRISEVCVELQGFYGKCFEKKKLQSFRLIMANIFIQMAASADHIVAYTIGPIFNHIIAYVQLYFTNGFTHIIHAMQ